MVHWGFPVLITINSWNFELVKVELLSLTRNLVIQIVQQCLQSLYGGFCCWCWHQEIFYPLGSCIKNMWLKMDIKIHMNMGPRFSWQSQWIQRWHVGGSGPVRWHLLQPLTISSMSVSNFGHQITVWANAFISDIPGCPMGNSSKSHWYPCIEISTWVPP